MELHLLLNCGTGQVIAQVLFSQLSFMEFMQLLDNGCCATCISGRSLVAQLEGQLGFL